MQKWLQRKNRFACRASLAYKLMLWTDTLKLHWCVRASLELQWGAFNLSQKIDNSRLPTACVSTSGAGQAS